MSEVDDIQEAVDAAIRMNKIPEQLHDDARQEGFLAFYEGKSVLGHLLKWWRQEKRHMKHFKTNAEDIVKEENLIKRDGMSFYETA